MDASRELYIAFDLAAPGSQDETHWILYQIDPKNGARVIANQGKGGFPVPPRAKISAVGGGVIKLELPTPKPVDSGVI